MMQDQRGLVLDEKGDWNFSTAPEGQQSRNEPGLTAHPALDLHPSDGHTDGIGNPGHPNITQITNTGVLH